MLRGSPVVHAASTTRHVIELFSHRQVLGDIYLLKVLLGALEELGVPLICSLNIFK